MLGFQKEKIMSREKFANHNLKRTLKKKERLRMKG